MKDLRRGSGAWINMVRSSLKKVSEEDGQYLEMILASQSSEPLKYALSDSDRKKLWSSVVNSEAGQIAVSIPDDENGISNGHKVETVHTQIQASLAQIGESMGLRIWLPIADRQRILELWRPNNDNVLLTHLPLNYDNVTLRIIENIDVLWIRCSAIVRAFEVENTTSIYSGILRMADLMSCLLYTSYLIKKLKHRL